MSDNKTQFMPFPKEKQDALAAAQAAKLQSVAHFPKPVDLPGIGKTPIMVPATDANMRPQQQQRPAVTHHQTPLGATPVTATQHNMTTHAMGHSERQAAPPQVQGLDWAMAPAPQFRTPPQAMAAPIPEPLNQVPNVMPGFSNPVADGEATSVALPSRFAFYGFKDVYVKPFVAKHIAKLQKAHREQSLLPVVEAVSAVISTSDPRYAGVPIGFELSLPDFFFVLYWLRLNSFTKSNYVHTTRCNDEGHLKRVTDGLNLEQYAKQVQSGEMTPAEYQEIAASVLPEKSLEISQMLTNTNMKVNELESVPDPEVFHFSEGSRMFFRPPTMRDVIEFAEAPEMQDKETREEFAFLAQLATHMQHMDQYLSLQDRVKIVEEATPDQIMLIKDFEKAIRDYGVVETVQVTCKECGAVRKSKLSLAAHSFLPS